MKLKKLIYGVSLAAIIAAGSSCNKAKFNINRNPNDPTDSSVTYDVVLPAALHASGAIVATQWGTIQNWMGFWARSGTYAPNVTEETYQITTGFGNGIWNNCYDNNYDYNIVQVKAHIAGADFYEGIARIMKALNFQTLVDVYGNVPYGQALKGSGNPTPAYDNGIDIYKDLLRQIDTGITLIKGAVVTATNPNKNIWTNDIMFGDPVNGVIGNVAAMKLKWRKFGNTLKLRMLIHAYAVAGINKPNEMTIINNDGSGFLGVDQDAQVQPGYKSDKPNPFYTTYKTTTAGAQAANNVYYRANKWGIGYYVGDGDPRINQAASSKGGAHVYEAGSGGLVGVAYGLPPVTANASSVLAGIGPAIYKTPTSPQCILSAAESFFLQAEARQRGWITSGPTAQALMEQGILESFKYMGIPIADAPIALADYLSYNGGYPDVDYTAGPISAGNAGGGIATILSQKWFALNGINTLEVWSDYRRVPFSEVATMAGASTTHFTYGTAGGYTPGPTISVAPQNTSTVIPVRYMYPQTEYNYNAANVGAQGVINPFSSRVFWDLN
jgi:hypothetical protein